MKLLLALSVVVVALVVLAEPSSADTDVKDRLEAFGTSVKDFASKISEKTKTAFKETSNWFSDKFQKIKEKIKS